MKRCSACGEDKPRDDFYANRRSRGGLQSICKQCSSRKSKERYAKTEYREARLASNRKARETSRELLKRLKDAPCVDCGVRYPPYVMDFDHLPEHVKVAAVGYLQSQGRLSQMLDEIKKCDLVCANCHRERTHQRRLMAD